MSTPDTTVGAKPLLTTTRAVQDPATRGNFGLAGLAAIAPGGEKVGPGNHLGVLLDQRPPLALGQAAPNTPLHMVVERVGEALGDDETTPTNNSRSLLRLSASKEVVGIFGATPRFRYPLDAGFGLRLAAGVDAEWIHVGCSCAR